MNVLPRRRIDFWPLGLGPLVTWKAGGTGKSSHILADGMPPKATGAVKLESTEDWPPMNLGITLIGPLPFEVKSLEIRVRGDVPGTRAGIDFLEPEKYLIGETDPTVNFSVSPDEGYKTFKYDLREPESIKVKKLRFRVWHRNWAVVDHIILRS